MARSHVGLFPQVCDWANLVRAYQRCRRRKRCRRPATRFDFEWESQLLTLQRELRDATYRPGPYRNFEIRDPKPRLISAAPFRDRVVHHAIIQVLEPIYERRFLHDSYACRRFKGTHRALRRAQHYLRRHAFCLKTDVVRFFPNVDHAILNALLAQTIADQALLALLEQIIASGDGLLREQASHHWFPGDDLFAVLRPRGLPIGNLTSQFFANVLLDQADHLIKDHLRIPGYVRYADDLLLFADDRATLWRARDALRVKLAELRLKLHPDKTVLVPTSQGVNFLGLRLWSDTARLQQHSIRRFLRRRREWQRAFAAGEMSSLAITPRLLAWLAHATRVNSRGLRRDLWRDLIFQRDSRDRSQHIVPQEQTLPTPAHKPSTAPPDS